jgi:hypothetical protein
LLLVAAAQYTIRAPFNDFVSPFANTPSPTPAPSGTTRRAHVPAHIVRSVFDRFDLLSFVRSFVDCEVTPSGTTSFDWFLCLMLFRRRSCA